MARKFAKKKTAKKRPPTLSQLKAKAWALLSQIVRLQAADEYGWVKCVSCGELKFWRDLQAGHWVDGRNNAVLFERDGVHPQCSKCNVTLNGNKVEYTKYMESKYSAERLEELRLLRHKNLSWTRDELEDRIDAYKHELKRLEKQKPVAASGRDL